MNKFIKEMMEIGAWEDRAGSETERNNAIKEANELYNKHLATVFLYKLKYFTTGNGMCASDLENTQQIENINLQQISSLSDMKKFHSPLSGTYKGDYAVVKMQNGNNFYIDKTEHAKISEALNCG